MISFFGYFFAILGVASFIKLSMVASKWKKRSEQSGLYSEQMESAHWKHIGYQLLAVIIGMVCIFTANFIVLN